MPNRMGSITLKVSNKLIFNYCSLHPPNHSLLFSFGVNSLKKVPVSIICSGKIPHHTPLLLWTLILSNFFFEFFFSIFILFLLKETHTHAQTSFLSSPQFKSLYYNEARISKTADFLFLIIFDVIVSHFSNKYSQKVASRHYMHAYLKIFMIDSEIDAFFL